MKNEDVFIEICNVIEIFQNKFGENIKSLTISLDLYKKLWEIIKEEKEIRLNTKFDKKYLPDDILFGEVLIKWEK